MPFNRLLYAIADTAIKLHMRGAKGGNIIIQIKKFRVPIYKYDYTYEDAVKVARAVRDNKLTDIEGFTELVQLLDTKKVKIAISTMQKVKIELLYPNIPDFMESIIFTSKDVMKIIEEGKRIAK